VRHQALARVRNARATRRITLRPKLTEIVYDERGLIPVVVQDDASGEILMLAYANADAVAQTLSTGELHLWSRSRGELWHKGATSGNTQRVVALRLDCDRDALLAIVTPAGPACHTGERSCFFNVVSDGEVPHEALPEVERVLAERAADQPTGSYSVQLLNDQAFAAAKVREEAEEVGRAVLEESDERVDEEAADLLFHLTALLHSRGHSLAEAQRVLLQRRR
jgi:phosphoribosyl-AMP cyclohydrolase / phosphoribosyl-ATP pyrophosphohydrolase